MYKAHVWSPITVYTSRYKSLGNGSTLCIGITMAFDPCIWKFTSYFQFQVITAQHMSKLSQPQYNIYGHNFCACKILLTLGAKVTSGVATTFLWCIHVCVNTWTCTRSYLTSTCRCGSKLH